MREEDSARRAARRVHLQRGEQEDGAARTRSARSREYQIFADRPRSSTLRGRTREENLSNKYREERTHECRQKSPNDQLRWELLRHVRLFLEIPADF